MLVIKQLKWCNALKILNDVKVKQSKKKVIYYGHSTMEDFKNSFIGSNLAAPIFKKLDLLLL